MTRPEPRPALRRSEDGTVHPAAPRVSPPQHLHPVPHAPAAATLGSADAADAAVEPAGASTPTRFTGKAVMLAVKIPKDLRKAVRRLAKRQGRSVDVVVTEALTEHVKEHS